MSPRTLWISSAAVLGALAAVGLYLRSPQVVSRKSEAPLVTVREKPTALTPVVEDRERAVFSVSERGERLVVAMDEVCLKAAGETTYVKLDPPATMATMAARLREFAPKFEALPVAYPENVDRSEAARVIVTRRLRVKLPQDAAARVAGANGLDVTSRPEYAPNWVIMNAADPMAALAVVGNLRTTATVTSADVLVARKRYARVMPNDTLINDQWHLKNPTTSPSITHANVENAWKYGLTGGVRGAGIRIGIVDDGVQTDHPDLVGNIDTANNHWDWNGGDSNPSPEANDRHGTAVAGVAAAVGNNGLGVSGVAPSATLVGMRLISDYVDDGQEEEAMGWKNDIIQVKNNSWGPYDPDNHIEGPGELTAEAFVTATTSGRGGKGTIFVWAAGNGKLSQNNSNYDGYANSIHTIAVAATDSLGQSSNYSEPGANILIAAPSSGGSGTLGVVTTDRTGGSSEVNGGYNYTGKSGELADRDYTKNFNGTSSSTPVVSGVVALMLEKNPNLGWRDVQEILIRTARKVQPTDSGWKMNGGDFRFHHQFGAGLVDAAAAVDMAATWTNLPPQTDQWQEQNTPVSIPNNNPTGVTKSFVFTSTAHRVEHVTVEFSTTHSSWRELDITLTSPSGMVSQLASASTNLINPYSYSTWTFSSVQHWGESAAGTWTVKVADRSNSDTSSWTLGNVKVTLFGSTNNPPPEVAITSPANGQGFSLGSEVNVQVSATDTVLGGAPGVVSNVELLLDGAIVGSDSTAPYEFTVNPGAGVHSLVARATDNEDEVSESAAVSIVMGNQAPVIAGASLSSSVNHYADQPLSVASINASDPENSPIIYSYQWQFSLDRITYVPAGQTTATLAASAGNAGKMWRCVISASDGTKTSTPFTTAAVNLLTRPQIITSTGSAYQYTSDLVLKGVEETVNRRAIINEFSQSSGLAEWVEILVLQRGSLAGFQLRNSREGSATRLTFGNHAIWNDVPAGTLVVVYRYNQRDGLLPVDDIDLMDKRLIVPSSAVYFTAADWMSLDSTSDALSLRPTSSSEPIHSLSFGGNNMFPLNVGDASAGRAAYFAGGKDLQANEAIHWGTCVATGSRGTTANPGSGVTPGEPNSPANESFITKLRNNAMVTPALFRLAAGSSLPGGLTLNSSTGMISGTVASGNVGNHSITIERYNTEGEVVSQNYTLTVAAANYAEWIGGFSVASTTGGSDPDFDGLPNLIEYLLGLDPKVREATPAIATTAEEGGISLTYRQSKLPQDATLIPEWSAGLAAEDTWQTSGLTTQVLEEDDRSRLLKVTLSIAPEEAKRFLRLRAVTAP